MTATIQRYAPPSNGRAAAASQATSIEQSRAIADVQAAVTVAQNCPRDMADAEREMEYVCSRLDMAEQAFYQVTNRGSGPSVHLMRELARIWGNVDYGVKELARNDDKGESEVLATCWDMQKNTRSSRTFIVPHQRMRAGQRTQLVDLTDIYLNNQNVGARAVRECIQTILPRWFTEKAQDICRHTLEHGEGEPLQDRINTMVAWFRDKIGVTEKQLEARLGKKRGAWSAEDVAQMKIAGKSITAGEVGRDEIFPPIDAETVDELACTADTDAPPAGKLRGKVKPAGAGKTTTVQEEESRVDAGADSAETQEADANDTYDGADLANTEPPGAPTESTPGQTDRVAKALSAAKSRSSGLSEKARRQCIDEIEALFNQANCGNPEDRHLVLGEILGTTIQPETALTDTQLTKVAAQLDTWNKHGDLDAQIREALNTADIRANQDGQQTIDGGN
ncbi:hypothetical protein DSM43518_04820 [Mycobacterium marinum]|nr:hypothetical protein CCUG20998_03882 [Mycobacterium marinum]RFZ02833.1 hypothetical protein DSM43518_04820 [Mycobacterium marinum]RFZ26024.1 hypothetical protein DSM43519_01338 [Mycobacterium marinum]RFZ28903.1 hypothetical protein DSM44344_01170 [Mycobacterium marinum]RFZ39089.1 hypothetical protein NCTC2275_00357 [Mycobacterium marinum]